MGVLLYNERDQMGGNRERTVECGDDLLPGGPDAHQFPVLRAARWRACDEDVCDPHRHVFVADLCRTAQGSDPMIFRISSSVKARMVSVRMLPCAPRASDSFATVSSSGASAMPTWSYWPITRYNALISMPMAWAACLAASCRAGLSFTFSIPCWVQRSSTM